MADSRVTQAGVMVGETSAGAPMRVTQAGYLVGVATETPPCLTMEADAWKITRTDGTVYRFTSHDRDLTYKGETYKSCGGLSSSALQLSAELGATDNVDLSGLVYTGGITALDIWTNKLEGATVEVYRIAWGGETSSQLVMSGTIGARDLDDTTFKFEVVTDGEKLAQTPVLSVTTPSCRWKFGDSRCTFNTAAVTVSGTVTSIPAINLFTGARRRQFTDTGRGETTGRFTLGRLTWLTGDNAGIASDVKLYQSQTFVLADKMPRNIAPGDTYSVVPGCDRTAETCDTTWSNKINFGGFDKIRGSDDLAQTPAQDV